MIGSDDGAEWWSLTGKWNDQTNSDLEIDFSPKGGPSSLKGKYSCESEDVCKITWEDNN